MNPRDGAGGFCHNSTSSTPPRSRAHPLRPPALAARPPKPTVYNSACCFDLRQQPRSGCSTGGSMTERPIAARLLPSAASLLLLATCSWAALPAGHSSQPRLIGPDDQSVASASGLSFAWLPPMGAQRDEI